MHNGFLLLCFKSAAYLMCCSKFSPCSRLKVWWLSFWLIYFVVGCLIFWFVWICNRSAINIWFSLFSSHWLFYLFLLFYSWQNSHLEVNGDIFVSVISHLNEIPGSKKKERRCMDSLFIWCAVNKFLYFAAWSIGYVIIPRG